MPSIITSMMNLILTLCDCIKFYTPQANFLLQISVKRMDTQLLMYSINWQYALLVSNSPERCIKHAGGLNGGFSPVVWQEANAEAEVLISSKASFIWWYTLGWFTSKALLDSPMVRLNCQCKSAWHLYTTICLSHQKLCYLGKQQQL